MKHDRLKVYAQGVVRTVVAAPKGVQRTETALAGAEERWAEILA